MLSKELNDLKTLDEYVRKLVEDAHGEHDIRLAKERVQRYTKECERKGYYEVIGNRHFERTGTMCMYPITGCPMNLTAPGTFTATITLR